jgi:hypothetical protein
VPNIVSKRYNITLPDGIAEALEQWAEGEKNKPSTLAAFLVESAVRQAIDQGKISPPMLGGDK